MKTILITTALILAVSSLFLACSRTTGPEERQEALEPVDYVRGQIIVDFSNEIPLEAAQAAISDLGLLWDRTLSVRLRIAVVGVPTGSEIDWVARLKNHELVETAQVNHTGIDIR